MQVGTLVKSKYSWNKNIGICIKHNTGGFVILWSNGEYGFTIPSDVEAICK